MLYHNFLTQALELGAVLLENGAETYRVEESLLRIFQGRGVKRVEVFAIPSMLIVTIHPDDTYKSFTQQKRILSRGTNLHKISEANELCRYLCSHDMSAEELEKEIQKIRNGPYFSQLTQYIAHGITGAGFSLFFGGSVMDAFFALFSGFMVKFIFDQMGKLGTNTFFTNVLASAVLTAWAGLISMSPLHGDMDMIIIGPMMLLVPGMALTTGMRDIIAGDYLSSIVKLTEVLMIGLGVALGAYISMSAMGLLL